MKKTLLTLGAAAFLLSFSSCKKDWTCTCEFLGTAGATVIPDATRGDAHDKCDALETSARSIDPDAECEIGD
jgi:hypothetical protein